MCAAAAAGRVPRRGVRSSGSGACGAAVAAAGRAARVRDEPRAGAACVRAGVCVLGAAGSRLGLGVFCFFLFINVFSFRDNAPTPKRRARTPK